MNTPNMNTLPERIRAAREQAGLTQTDVAKALRLSPSAVNQWEQGLTKNMKLSHFFALASLLEKDPRWLATGKTHPRAREDSADDREQAGPTSEEKALLHYVCQLVCQLPDALRKVLVRFLKGLYKVHVSPDAPDRDSDAGRHDRCATGRPD